MIKMTSPLDKPAAETDLLGAAATVKPQQPVEHAPAAGASDDAGLNTGTSGLEGTRVVPAEDVNQPGFIGERNLPHP